jgi:DNA replication protein DnaC
MPSLVIDDLGVRRLPQAAAEDLMKIVIRRDEKSSTLINKTSNRPVEAGANSSATPPPSVRPGPA